MNVEREEELRIERRRNVFVISIVFLLVVTALAALVFMVIWRTWVDPEELVAVATAELKMAVNQDSHAEQIAHARRAEDAATQLKEISGFSNSGKILLWAAIALRQHEYDFTVQDRTNFEALANGVDLAACRVNELTAATEALFHAGDVSKADWIITNLLDRKTDGRSRIEILRLAVQIKYDLGAEDQVFLLGRELAQRDKSSCIGWVAISYVYKDRTAPEGLVDTYRELIARRCENVNDTRRKLIEQLIELGESDAARTEFETLKRESPELLESHASLLPKLLLLEGNVRDAATALDAILKSDPRSSEALILNARLALGRNEPQSAISDLMKVVESEPANTEAIYNLGQAYIRNGQPQLGKQQLARHRHVLDAKVELHRLERLAGMRPNNAQIKLTIAQKYQELGFKELADHWRRLSANVEN